MIRTITRKEFLSNKTALLDLTLLFLMSILAMMGAHLAPLRYDVR